MSWPARLTCIGPAADAAGAAMVTRLLGSSPSASSVNRRFVLATAPGWAGSKLTIIQWVAASAALIAFLSPTTFMLMRMSPVERLRATIPKASRIRLASSAAMRAKPLSSLLRLIVICPLSESGDAMVPRDDTGRIGHLPLLARVRVYIRRSHEERDLDSADPRDVVGQIRISDLGTCAVKVSKNGQCPVGNLDGPHAGLPGDGPQERLHVRVSAGGAGDGLPVEPQVYRVILVADDLAGRIAAIAVRVQVHLDGEGGGRGLLDALPGLGSRHIAGRRVA